MHKRELISQIIDDDYYEPCTLSKFKDKKGNHKYVITYHYNIIFFDDYKELADFTITNFREETSKRLLYNIEAYPLKNNEAPIVTYEDI